MTQGLKRAFAPLRSAACKTLFVSGVSYWTLFFLFGWHPSDAVGELPIDASWIYFMGGIIFASVFMIMVAEFRSLGKRLPQWALFCGCLTALAFALLQAGLLDSSFGIGLCASIMGFGFGVLGSLFGIGLIRFDETSSALLLSIEFIAASCIAIVLQLFANRLVVCIVFACLSVVCSWALSSSALASVKAGENEERPLPNRGVSSDPVMAVMLMFAMGVTYGILRRFSGTLPGGEAVIAEANTYAFLIAGCLMVATVAIVAKRNFLDKTILCSIVFVAAGFLLSIFFDLDGLGFLQVSYIGHSYNAILLYIVAAALARSRPRVLWVTAVPLVAFAMNAGQLFGTFFVPVGDVGIERAAYLVTTAVLLVFLISFICVHLYNLGSVPRLLRESERALFDAACDFLAAEYGLTQREREVFCLIALGKSNKQVEKALVLSADTVKTHIRHIYGKLNIHSRKELEEKIAAVSV